MGFLWLCIGLGVFFAIIDSLYSAIKNKDVFEIFGTGILKIIVGTLEDTKTR